MGTMEPARTFLRKRVVVLGVGLLFLLLSTDAQEAKVRYSVEGEFTPPATGSVGLSGATTPFHKSTLSSTSGRFRLKDIEEGTYTLSVFVPGRGEVRQTLVVSPSTADSRRRIHVEVAMEDIRLDREGVANVSVRSLAVPEKAQREYQEANKRLEQRDVAGAEQRLLRAVELAPHYGEAWNFLGTLAYQTQRYPLAEERFRKALDIDDTLYAPLVNLGGVLLNLGKAKEALPYNQHAILRRPGDALAHSQLGMTHFALNQLPQAEKHLREAIRLDPAHFSHPQIFLAEVLLRDGRIPEALTVLEGFLEQYPDHPIAADLRKRIDAARATASPSTASPSTVPPSTVPPSGP
jgi:predicted Zn-dependent protease